MILDVFNSYSNGIVSDYYVSIISESFNQLNYETRYIKKLTNESARTSDAVVVVACRDAITAKKTGYKKVILWIQGVSPEESFMRHHNIARWLFLSIKERKGIKKSDFIFYCSDEMKKHYEKKYKINRPFYIMPCFNDEINSNIILKKDIIKPVFIYAGNLDKWQCFEETVELYSKIEKCFNYNCDFRILTKNQEQAISIVKKFNIKNYSIGFVSHDEIPLEMKKATFGFCLRRNSIVNRVSTPTKFSTYIGYGVMPIYTKYVKDFYLIAKDNKYCFCYDFKNDNTDFYSSIIKSQQVNYAELNKSFKESFECHYSKKHHMSMIIEKFKKQSFISNGQN